MSCVKWYEMMAGILLFGRACLTGFGQILLQPKAVFGALLLLGVAYADWRIAVGGIVGVVVATLTAYILGADRHDIADGLYGFNGTLVGIALHLFVQWQPSLLVYVVVGAVLATLLMDLAIGNGYWRLPVYAAPFIAVTWFMFALINAASLAEFRLFTPLPVVLPVLDPLLRAPAQVLFQSDTVVGIVYLLGLLWYARSFVPYIIIAVLVAMLTATTVGLPSMMIENGVFGFNAVLCALMLPQLLAGTNMAYAVVVTIVGAILTTLLLAMMTLAGIVSLTAPFVLTMWCAHMLYRY